MIKDKIPETSPWWLTEGTELCDFCLAEYHFEAGFHCSECDSPVCPTCVVFVQTMQSVLCPQCHQNKAVV